MLTPMKGNRPLAGRPWAADNGCFATPDKYSDAMYLGWLSKLLEHKPTCLFATAPDVVGDARATLERSTLMMPVIRTLGYPVAFIAQDGIHEMVVPWDDFDCLFVGGTTVFKLHEDTYALVREAKLRGKWTHMGRVNSLRRLQAAQVGGYDSADGTTLAFAPDANLLRVQKWMRVLAEQPALDIA